MTPHNKKEPFLHLDIPLLIGILTLILISSIVLYSAGGSTTMLAQLKRIALAGCLMICVSYLSPKLIRFFVPAFYVVTIILLLLVEFKGISVNGARRWLSVGGIQFQPSELAKTSLPLMLAYYYSNRPLPPTIKDIVITFVIIGLPTFLIFKEPDLGTASLVAMSSLVILFLAGISWRIIIVFIIAGLVTLPTMWFYGMKDYQKERVITFLNPELDRQDSGYNIIQSKIAIGSGGLEGKGWMQGTQSQLEFLPERTTDFIFAVYAEEFGFTGILFLFFIYLFVLARGYWLSIKMTDNFSRLGSGGILFSFFIYFLINVGMVSGVFPVVGLPLPLISYGGTSAMTILVGFGLIMSFYFNRKINQN